MKLEFVPLLQVQRDIYRIPGGMERFHAYLRAMIDWQTEDMRLPLGVMNPMAKDHVPAYLDRLLALDADAEAARAVAGIESLLAEVPGEYRIGLVVVDDVLGGWTNRYACDFSHRFDSEALARRGWLVGMLWCSEPPTIEKSRMQGLTSVYRAAYIQRHGPAQTLRERMAQEGQVLALAGCTEPVLEPDDLAYTEEVLAPYLDATDMRTAIECLYGDAAGRTLGFTPSGLSANAGLALALHRARTELSVGNRQLTDFSGSGKLPDGNGPLTLGSRSPRVVS
jgi:hypothetical protein